MRYDPANDAYAILGVRPQATRDEVDAAFRRAVLQWHPDKNPAPDAAEVFHKIQQAARILRTPRTRREYDRLRGAHHRTPPPSPRVRQAPPEPYVPLAGAPAWLSADARVVHDGVLFPLVIERPSMIRELMVVVMALSAGAMLFTLDFTFFLLGVLAYSILRVNGREPHRWTAAWLKVVPGRREAQYSRLDERVGLFVRYEVPWAALQIALTQRQNAYEVEIRGFPEGSVRLLDRTRDFAFARRCAEEAGAWLGLPVAGAA
jgi:hypothetical protein